MCFIRRINLPFALWVVISYLCFVDLQQLAHFLEHLGLCPSMITLYADWHTLSTHLVLHQNPCHLVCKIIGDGKCLSPPRKT